MARMGLRTLILAFWRPEPRYGHRMGLRTLSQGVPAEIIR